jgi:hypothetical protein
MCHFRHWSLVSQQWAKIWPCGVLCDASTPLRRLPTMPNLRCGGSERRRRSCEWIQRGLRCLGRRRAR